MGLGHVPSGPIPREGSGPHFSRRQCREAGEDGAQALTSARAHIGATGESIAAWFLTTRGLSLQASNVVVDGGEIDLVMRDGRSVVAVEVRTVTGPGDPIDAVGITKRNRVRHLARQVGVSRVDFVGVGLRRDALEIHWVPG